MATDPREQIKSFLHDSCLAYPNIDWAVLAKACAFYSAQGFLQKETPWLIPEQVSTYTKPHSDPSFIQYYGIFEKQPHELVGSAEQGFIYLIQSDSLAPGKYFSVSPCFRVERFDETHMPWFIKVELIDFDVKNPEAQLFAMINTAKSFFESCVPTSLIDVVKCPDSSWDINISGIEVGSYGLRWVGNQPYIYGTGLALPRLSVAMAKK